MKPLDPRAQQHIIDLLAPFATNPDERRSLLIHALGPDHSLLQQIDFTGPTMVFLPHMIKKLSDFGQQDDGRPPLWTLLGIVRELVGLDVKHLIDALRPAFDLPLPPQLDRVFVSYSRKNERDAQRIVSDLKDAGLRVWYDREKIKGGEDWWQSIERGIVNADYFIFCLSPDAIRSKVARDELLTAREHQKPIFAVMLQDCLDELKDEVFAEIMWLPMLHIISFTQPEAYGDKLRELIQSLPGYTPPDSYFIDQYDPRDLPNPFRGLEAFLEVNAAYFSGREDAVEELLTRVQSPDKPRLLAVVGASGSGKSSLVRAGLIPALRQARPFWQTLTIKPGSDPIAELADRLQERLGALAERTRDRLRENTSALDDIAAELLAGKDEARLVLVIDQFEELFTLTSAADCQIILNLLLYAVNKKKGKVQLILTLRADFFDRLSAVPELARLVRENLDIATEMTADQLRRSIEDPALKVGVSYEQGLVETILEDVRSQPGSLPLLQFALKELFERKLGRRMTHEAYDILGGVKGALATRAETLYNALNPEQQEALRRILLRLVEVGEETVTRRREAQTDLVFTGISETVVQGILDQLTDADTRLLVVSAPLDDDNLSNDDQIFYEVSHEALLTHWKRLADWITESRDDLRHSSEILELSRQWSSTNRLETSYLLSGGRLITAREWLARGDPIQVQRDFIEASTTYSEQQRQREVELQRRALNRARQLAASFAVFLVVAMGLALYALDQRNQSLIIADAFGTQAVRADNNADDLATQAIRADNNAATAERRAIESRSLALAAEAQVQDQTNSELALQLAVEANALPDPPPLAQSVLSRLAYRGGSLIAELTASRDPVGDYVSELVFSGDGRFIATGTASGLVRVWDASTYALLHEMDMSTLVQSLAFSADGRSVIAGGGELTTDIGALRLWDIEADTSISLKDPGGQVTSVGFMPDDKTVFSSDIMGDIAVWRAADGAQIRRWPSPQTTLGNIALISPDGTLIYRVMPTEQRVIAWDWDADIVTKEISLRDIGRVCGHAALHPDGQRLLCGGSLVDEKGLYLIDLSTGTQLNRYQPANEMIDGLAFSADGSRFVTGQSDGLRVWDTENGAIIQTIHPTISNVASMAFSHDGTRLAAETFNGRFGVWDTELISRAVLGEPLLSSQQLIDTEPFGLDAGLMSALLYLPTGDTLLEGDPGGVYAFDLNTNKPYLRLKIDGGANSLALLPNGDLIIGTGEGGLIRQTLGIDAPVWSIRAHSAEVRSVAVSHDGQTILTGSMDGLIRLWEAESGTLLNTFEGLPYGVRAVAFTGDQGMLAFGCVSYSSDFCSDSEVQVWELSTQMLRYSLPVFFINETIAVSPDGTLFALVNDDYQLELYNSATGVLIRRFVGHSNLVFDMTFSSHGKYLLSGGFTDQLVIEWDVSTGTPLRQIEANRGIQVLAFAPNNQEFATIAVEGLIGDFTLLRWRLDDTIDSLLQWTQSHRLGYTFNCGQRERFNLVPLCDASGMVSSQTPFPSVTPSPTLDLTRITSTPSRTPTSTPSLTPSPTSVVTPTLAPQTQVSLPDYKALSAVEWSPDGKMLFASDAGGQVIVWDSLTGEEAFRFAGKQGHWSPDGTRIVTWGDDHVARVWSILSGLITYALEGHTDTIQQVRWSQDSKRLVTISRDGTARVWDSLTGKTLTTFRGSGVPLNDGKWSPDSSHIVTSADDGSVRLWDAATGEERMTFRESTDRPVREPLYELSWAPDGAHLLAAGDGILLWDATGGDLRTLDMASDSAISGNAWSPDGTHILIFAEDSSVSIWDINTGQRLATLDGHTDQITQAFWQPDGKQILTVSLDGTLRFWDGITGAPLRTIDTHEPLSSAQLSPDGLLFATTSSQGTIRLWNMRSGREQLFIFPPALAAPR